MLSRFHIIPERDRQSDIRTDGRTEGRMDRIAISISCVSVLTHDNNHDFRPISRFILEMMQDRAIVTMEGD